MLRKNEATTCQNNSFEVIIYLFTKMIKRLGEPHVRI